MRCPCGKVLLFDPFTGTKAIANFHYSARALENLMKDLRSGKVNPAHNLKPLEV